MYKRQGQRRWLSGAWDAAEGAQTPKVARNSLRSVFGCGLNPHDFNGPISKFERGVGELRATLLGICWVWAHGTSGSVTHVPSLPVRRVLCGRGSRAGYPSPMESVEIA